MRFPWLPTLEHSASACMTSFKLVLCGELRACQFTGIRAGSDPVDYFSRRECHGVMHVFNPCFRSSRWQNAALVMTSRLLDSRYMSESLSQRNVITRRSYCMCSLSPSYFCGSWTHWRLTRGHLYCPASEPYGKACVVFTANRPASTAPLVPKRSLLARNVLSIYQDVDRPADQEEFPQWIQSILPQRRPTR